MHVSFSFIWLFFVESKIFINRFRLFLWRGLLPISVDILVLGAIVSVTGIIQSPFLVGFFILTGISSVSEDNRFGIYTISLSILIILSLGLLHSNQALQNINLFTGALPFISLETLFITLFWLSVGLIVNHLIIIGFVKRSMEENRNALSAKEKSQALLGKIKKDLTLAGKIQKNLMPEKTFSYKGLDFSTWFEPASEIGGDTIGFYRIDEERVRFYIADATGHGIQAALLTMLIRSEISEFIFKEKKVNEVLEKFNESYYNKYYQLNYFCSIAIVEIDIRKGKLTYSSGGHPAQFMANGKNWITLFVPGKLLGLQKKSIYNLIEVDLKSDFALFLFSDGLFEEFSKSREMYGEERLEKDFKEVRSLSPLEICQFMQENLNNFRSGKGFSDDISLLVCRNSK